MLVSAAGTAEAQVEEDPWLGPDKALHFSVSAALAAGGYGVGAIFWEDYTPRLLLGAGFALSLGIAKEVYDAAGNGTASWRDMAWNFIGIGAGLLVAFLIDLAVHASRDEPPPSAARLLGRGLLVF